MLDNAFAALAEQLELIRPDDDEVAQAVRQIRDLAGSASGRNRRPIAERLARLLVAADADGDEPTLSLLFDLLTGDRRPWDLVAPLFAAENLELAEQTLTAALDAVEAGRLPCDRAFVGLLAATGHREDGPLDDEDLLLRVRDTLRRRYGTGGRGRGRGLQGLLSEDGDPELRRLAARLLDLEETLPGPALTRRLLGERAWRVLGAYLRFSRATHADLAALSGGRPVDDRVLDRFAAAEREHGQDVVRAVVAELGWTRVNRGLRIERCVPLDWPGTAPLYVHPEEIGLFATTPPPRRGAPVLLVTTQGGREAVDQGGARQDRVDRFRRLNIDHAELLSEFLETAPAGLAKLRRVIGLMDGIVASFSALFTELDEHYRILPDVWRDLRERAAALLEAADPERDPPADLVRLVMAFEDPANLGEVRTVHGLKRLLHQHGLKLGFSLVGGGHSPDRTVDLLLLDGRSGATRGPTVHFAVLEPAPEPDPDPWLPHPVRLTVEALAWQLLHGTTAFPGVEVFVFGNEVHTYVSFRNHPAFLRVDFSPPQRGGMLDLEYYGVSGYESDLHPNPDLDAIQCFFRALELEVRCEGTRLFVRYDKERSHSLADLQDKLSALLRMAPFLMSVDWVAGSLRLNPRRRQIVVDAWAERMARSGLFPTEAILTKDRTGVLVRRATGPGGTEEVVWDGRGPYRDRWSGEAPGDLWDAFTAEARRLDLPPPTAEARALTGPLPLLAIHRHILEPVRRRLRQGQLRVVDGRLEPADPALCRQEHETAHFARLLAGRGRAPDQALRKAMDLAPVLRRVEKFAGLHATGSVGALRVERGRLALRGGEVRLYAVRDEHGVIRLGACSFADRMLRRRESARRHWRAGPGADAPRLLTLLRSANYTGEIGVDGDTDPPEARDELRRLAARPAPVALSDDGNRRDVLEGTAAAPGRATGRAVFGTAGHRPEDLQGGLLIAREIRPDDSPYLMQAAGVVSTGGAVLSHAALLATQFGKPAMVIEAEWDGAGPVPALRFEVTLHRTERTTEGDLQVCRRSVTAHTSGRLVEGDLCILDARRGTLRVLGQEPDTLVLWQGLRLLGNAGGDGGDDPRRVLERRAQVLRARHQIRKALQRVTAATVADFAVDEIVLGHGLADLASSVRAELLAELLANAAVSDRVGPRLDSLARELADGLDAAVERYRQRTPAATDRFEILGLRLRCLRLQRSLELAIDLQRRCGLAPAAAPAPLDDGAAIARLGELAGELTAGLDDGLGNEGPHRRHHLRRLDRLREILPGAGGPGAAEVAAAAHLEATDRQALAEARDRLVLTPADCGLETHPLVGWKAANLAEMDRLAGAGTVPPWFAVGDAALRLMLAQPLSASETVKRHLGRAGRTLGAAIDAFLAMDSLDCAARARFIGQLWREATIPDHLAAAVGDAHARLLRGAGEGACVALRSSSCDEDSESSMQAGIYDTFLFVAGLDEVLDTLRRTWAGMWSERALFARQAAGDPAHRPAGGVVVQRMVDARVSGVMQTVNIAADELDEMVINVGLGLGEGIVSGLVAADLITVVKERSEPGAPLHFRYLTNDKPRQMVHDRRRGRGTRLADTLYHQRLRPAIEYAELREIVARARTLEAVYGYPLDIEFALEDDRLWLLQARPISTALAEHAATRDRHPLESTEPVTQPTGA